MRAVGCREYNSWCPGHQSDLNTPHINEHVLFELSA